MVINWIRQWWDYHFGTSEGVVMYTKAESWTEANRTARELRREGIAVRIELIQEDNEWDSN